MCAASASGHPGSLQGVAYDNDSQIVEIHAYLRDDKADPRVEVEIEEVGQ